jgi:pteridine reductase
VPEAPLSGKVALITGAAVRVGREITLALARAGADVAIHYRSSAEPAQDLAREVRQLGRGAETLPADLSRPEECRRLVRSALERLGRLDCLIHSAANFHRASLADTDERLWDDAMNVNARAGLLLAREAAAELTRREGRIVLISDLMAAEPPRNYLAHAVSKAATEGLVRALAVELAPRVTVNGIAPGAVLVPEGTSEEQSARYARKTLPQRLGDPADVAQAVLFFCAGPSFITGQILRVDGGQSIR